jgi:lipoprotein-releasing system permease protein
VTSLEWMLAGRYLKLLVPRTSKLHVLSLVMAVLALAVHGAYYWMSRQPAAPLPPGQMSLLLYLQWARPLSLMLLVMVAFFVVLVQHLTIFSTISTYALFLGTGAMVVVLSVMSGFEKDLKRKILGTNAHMVVTVPDRPFTEYREVAPKLAGVPGVAAVTPFLSNEVMISSASNLSGVVLKGIDPTSVGAVTDLSRNLEEGGLDYLIHPEKLKTSLLVPELEPEPKPKAADSAGTAVPAHQAAAGGAPQNQGEAEGDEDDEDLPPPPPRRVLPTVIIGRELAKTLHSYLGDEVNLVSPMGDIGPTGPIPRSRPFRVGGIFYSGMYEYDSKYIYVAIPAAQKFLGLDDEITGFELKLQKLDDTERPVQEIQRRLGPEFEVQSWQELNRHLFSALAVEQLAMFIVLCFVILVASFSIVANGIMLVREKGREIAILKSMGIQDRAVLRTFLYIGLFMGGIGTLVGVASGVAACFELRTVSPEINSDVFYISKLPVEINPYEIASVAVAALSIALLAILYPALQAARLRPVEGLRYDRN